MNVTIKFGNFILPLSIPAVLRMPNGFTEINPATAGMFLVMRALSSTKGTADIFYMPDLMFVALAAAARNLPGQSRVTMTGPVDRLDEVDPAAPVLQIDTGRDTFTANGVSVDWWAAQRWANNTVTTIPRTGLGCTMPWQFKMNTVVMRLATHLAARSSSRGLAWFENACQLTRQLVREERPDPNHLFDILSPEGAMAAGICWLDLFAKCPVICDLHPFHNAVPALYERLMDYADDLGELTPEELQAIATLASEIYADGTEAADVSAHQALALTGRAASLTAKLGALLDTIETPSSIG